MNLPDAITRFGITVMYENNSCVKDFKCSRKLARCLIRDSYFASAIKNKIWDENFSRLKNLQIRALTANQCRKDDVGVSNYFHCIKVLSLFCSSPRLPFVLDGFDYDIQVRVKQILVDDGIKVVDDVRVSDSTKEIAQLSGQLK